MSQITGPAVPVSQQQPQSLEWREHGWTAGIPYEDVNQARILTLAATAVAQGAVVHLHSSFGKTRMDTEYPFNFNAGTASSEFVPLWEMISKRADVSLFSPYNPLSANLTQAEIQLLKGIIQNIGTYTVGGGSTALPSLSANATEMLGLYLNDVTNFTIFVPELHFTKYVSAQYSIAASFSNTGKIYSSSTLGSVWGVPGGLLFSFPPVQSIPSTLSGFNLVWGWFTNGPEARQIARFKWQIIQTWEWGLWSQDMYGTLL